MAYRKDPDLEFLKQVKSEDLDDLVRCLIYDKDNERRWMQTLTNKELFKKHYPDHHQYWREIAAEIQSFGGNTIFNFFRGKGVLYKEVLTDVCDKMRVAHDKNNSTIELENCLLLKILEDAVKKMTPEELKKFGASLGKGVFDGVTSETAEAMLKTIFISSLASYQLSFMVAKATVQAFLETGLHAARMLGNVFMPRAFGAIIGPIGLVITGLWAAVGAAGPAYKVTVPAVILVAALRKKRSMYSIALIGDVGVGKTTLLRYLQKGEFVQICEETVVVEKNEAFESPLWQHPISSIDDYSGDPQFIRKQKELCKDKDLILFCYNPQKVLEGKIEKGFFLQRLQGLINEKVFFIATHSDCYDVNDMKKRMRVFFDSPSMGSFSKLLGSDNSFFVNLKNETETKNMLLQILKMMEAAAYE